MSAPTLTITDEAVAFVCDRMLTAAIGPNWRERAPEAITAFWMEEVRTALHDAAEQEGA